MIGNYFKITIRNMLKHKVYSLINILGLVVGLTCSMLMFIYVFHEVSYEHFHKNVDRIFRLGREISSSEGEIREPLSSAPTGDMLLQDYPEVIDMVRLKSMGDIVIRYMNNRFYEDDVYFADPSVFNVFTFPMLKGDPETALMKPYSIVISREMAEKYFPDEEPLGKLLTFNNKSDFIVTGVMENLPENTHLDINMLCSINTLYAQNQPELQDWLNFKYSTYLLLDEKANEKKFELKLQEFIDRYLGENKNMNEGTLGFYILPIKKIHLYSSLDGDPPGLISRVILYSLMAIFITLIACINFMNLTTARSTTRAKEIGLRKVNGANKHKLITQFMSETLIQSFIAFIFAFLFVKLMLPAFSNNLEEKLTLGITKLPGLFIGFIIITLFVGLISGSYPAFYLARLQPASILKSNFTAGRKRAGLRSVLVIIQFVLSTVLICQTMIMNYQLNYLKNKDIGFTKKDLIVLPIYDERIRQSLSTLKGELKNHPDVLDITAASCLPGLRVPRNIKIPEGFSEYEMQLMDDINVDHDFLKTLKVELVAGRDFSEEITTDRQNAIIINQLAAKKFGWDQPIGKTIQYSTGQDRFATGTIIGVVKDFHISSMHRLMEPLFISNNADDLHHIVVRINHRNVSTVTDHIQKTWNNLYPQHPFEYSFLENSYDRYYHTLEKVIQIFFSFAILAIILACLGIFALAAFIAERRTKEIGIRKVLGDNTSAIVLRLNMELLKYVLFAIIFIIPYAFLTKDLLKEFIPYFAKTNYLIYVKSMILVYIIAVLSISYQSVKAATANPIDALRYE